MPKMKPISFRLGLCLHLCVWMTLSSSSVAPACSQSDVRLSASPNNETALLEIEYAAGVAAYNKRQWTYAVVVFERILAIDHSFRDVRKRLARAERNLERESPENILSRYYADAADATARNDFGLARAALAKINAIDPGYQESALLLKKIENLLQQKQEKNPDGAFGRDAAARLLPMSTENMPNTRPAAQTQFAKKALHRQFA